MLPSPETNLRIAELPDGPRQTAEGLARSIRAQLAALGAYGEGGTPEEQKPSVDRLFDRSLKDSTSRAASLAAMAALTRDLTQLTELLTPKDDLTALRAALQNERTADGSSLESKLDAVNGERTLDAHLARAVAALADGPMGYTPDLSKLSFDLTPEKLVQLKAGIESGAITGAVLVAYPTRVQLAEIATRLKRPLAELLTMPVTTFLTEHFKARGGMVGYVNEKWAKLRTPPPGVSLSRLFHAASRERGIDPTDWCAKNADGTPNYRSLTPAYQEIHAAVHDALPPPQTLADVVDAPPQLLFTNTAHDVGFEAPQLTATGARTVAMGDTFSFARCMAEGIDPLSPAGHLARAAVASDLKDPDTYPNQRTYEHIAALTKGGAPYAYARDDGLHLSVNVASYAAGDTRAHSSLL